MKFEHFVYAVLCEYVAAYRALCEKHGVDNLTEEQMLLYKMALDFPIK